MKMYSTEKTHADFGKLEMGLKRNPKWASAIDTKMKLAEQVLDTLVSQKAKL